MKRIILLFNLLLTSFFCFAQQNLPARIIGGIPSMNSGKKYQIQVGAYRIEKNAEDAILQLRNIDLSPSTERFRDFTRVLVKEIPADQVRVYLASVAKAGFMEVIVREDAPSKGQVNNSKPSELLCKTWKIESCPNKELVGSLLYILNDGKYYVVNIEGESSSVSNWRWNSGGNEFEYTHNNWEYYGRVEIINLMEDYLELLDSGYSYDTPGRSSAGYSNRWVFSVTPAN
ncbi:MAG: hypothetical protein LBV17_06690 [Treponema sp.]|jgi:hypothetical protein|nr:hypothetical protein [Treponema sp.]